MAVVCPTWGPLRLAQQLALPAHGGWKLAASTIYRLLRRSGLQTRWERLAVLEAHSAQAAGLLTERTRRQLLAAQRRAGQHIQAEKPGELVCLDTFYIGKLKGVGKVWQITACDAASSFAVAQITLDFTARATSQFLAKRVVPAFRKAGWPVQRVLTDQGNEFRGCATRKPHPSKSTVEEPLEGEQARAWSGLRYVGESPLEWNGGPPGYQTGGLRFNEQVADPLGLQLSPSPAVSWHAEYELAK